MYINYKGIIGLLIFGLSQGLRLHDSPTTNSPPPPSAFLPLSDAVRMRRETVTVAAQVFNEHSYWSDTEYWFWTTQTYIHVWTNYLFSGVRRVLRISKQQHNADYKRRIYKCMPSSPSCVCNLDPSSSVTWNVSNCFLTCKNGKINETHNKLEPIWTRG